MGIDAPEPYLHPDMPGDCIILPSLPPPPPSKDQQNSEEERGGDNDSWQWQSGTYKAGLKVIVVDR